MGTTFDLRQVTPLLVTPSAGGQQYADDHNSTFTEIDGTWDSIRDEINGKIDWLNGLPLPDFVPTVQRLPETSLEEWVILPLSGDYRAIQANAEACRHADAAFGVWGENFVAIATGMFGEWEGEAALAFQAHLALFGKAMTAVGAVVGWGSEAFDVIAKFSEQLAIRVENIVVKLAQKLIALLEKVIKKSAGFWGFLATAFEVITEGTHVVTDIIEDVQEVIDLIYACVDLIDTIEAWAEEVRTKLEQLHEVVDVVRSIPEIASNLSLGDVADILQSPSPGLAIDALESELTDPQTVDDGAAAETLDEEISGIEEDTDEATAGEGTREAGGGSKSW